MADAIVIDRGYLGAEVESEVIAIAQKRMVAYCNTAGKPVLVANQMLESMRTHPRPTRSESAGTWIFLVRGSGMINLIGFCMHIHILMMIKLSMNRCC